MKLEAPVEDERPVRTYVDLVKYIENTLGWTWPWEDTRPPWKIRAIEAGKLKKLAAKHKYTVNDLRRTVDWMRRERIPVTSPAGVIYKVERALRESPAELEIGDLEKAIARTLREVKASDLPDAEKKRWVTRLSRVTGAAAVEAVDEWRSG